VERSQRTTRLRTHSRALSAAVFIPKRAVIPTTLQNNLVIPTNGRNLLFRCKLLGGAGLQPCDENQNRTGFSR